MSHVIRLHGPWQYRPLKRTVLLPDGTAQAEPGELPPPGQVQIPCDWEESLGKDFRGRVLYTRGFNRPTGLEDVDRIELSIECVDAFGCVMLNSNPLGEVSADSQPVCFDITKLLELYNTLEIEVELPRVTASSPPLPRPSREGLAGGIVGQVALEIYAR